MKRIMIIVSLAGALAGCSGGDDANNALSAEEAAGLNNAADMLDTSPDSLVANSEMPLGNGEEPMPEATANEGNSVDVD